MKYRIILPALAVGWLFCGSFAAHAQTPGAINQVDAAQQRRALEQAAQQQFNQGDQVPELYPGEVEDIGPQSVLAMKPRRTLFEGSADSQYFYSDNAFLNQNNREPSGILVSTVQLALAPTAYSLWGGSAAPRIGVRQQWYDFLQYRPHNPNFNSYDFNSETAFADETWTYHHWLFGAGMDVSRLLTTSSYHQFYSEYVPRWEVQRVIPVAEKHSFAIGYQGYYHFAHAAAIPAVAGDFADRLDQVGLVTYNYTPSTHVVIQPYYSFRYTHFERFVGRDDYLHSVGITGYYIFNQNFNARVFFGYDSRNSTLATAEYHQLGGGLGVDFNVRF